MNRSTPPKESDIAGALSRLYRQLEILEDHAGDLTLRLQLVLRSPDTDEPETNTPADPAPQTALGHHLTEATERMAAVNAVLESVQERLGL